MSQQTIDRDWLTPKQVAEVLQVQPATIRTWIKSGVLTASRINQRKFLIAAIDIEKLLEKTRLNAGE